jgi:hypothetical protein
LQFINETFGNNPDIIDTLSGKCPNDRVDSVDFLGSECCLDCCVICSDSVPFTTVIILPNDKGEHFVLVKVSIVPHPMIPEGISIK